MTSYEWKRSEGIVMQVLPSQGWITQRSRDAKAQRIKKRKYLSNYHWLLKPFAPLRLCLFAFYLSESKLNASFNKYPHSVGIWRGLIWSLNFEQ